METLRKEIRVRGESLVTILSIPDSYANLDNSEKAVVILLHGALGGTKDGPSDLFIMLAEKLANAGLASIRFDFLGSGESGGDYVNMTIANEVAEYSAVLEYARSLNFGCIGLLGDSFGSSIALVGLTPDIQALVLLWPAVYLTDTSFDIFLTPGALAELEEKGYITDGDFKVGPGFVKELQTIKDLEKEVKRISIPTLYIQGDNDYDCPLWQTAKAYHLTPQPKRLVVFPGGEHCLRKPEEQRDVIKHTVDWFVTYCKQSK